MALQEQIEAREVALLEAIANGDLRRMSRESERLERMKRVARATDSVREHVAAVRIHVRA